jgi:hypothetical protein
MFFCFQSRGARSPSLACGGVDQELTGRDCTAATNTGSDDGELVGIGVPETGHDGVVPCTSHSDIPSGQASTCCFRDRRGLQSNGVSWTGRS